jgi:hypothetical protein
MPQTNENPRETILRPSVYRKKSSKKVKEKSRHTEYLPNEDFDENMRLSDIRMSEKKSSRKRTS